RLHDLPSFAAWHVDKALHSQHVMQRDHCAQASKKCFEVPYRAPGYDKTLEIVVIVLRLQIVEGGPGFEIFFGCRAEAERDFEWHPPLSSNDEFDAGAKPPLDVLTQRREPLRTDEIGLVEDDKIGACQLVREHFLERIVVRERRVRRALARD